MLVLIITQVATPAIQSFEGRRYNKNHPFRDGFYYTWNMEFLDWLKVLVLGIVEGITEWLPISSTGHMVLVDALWPSANGVMTEDFMTMFEVVIQFGAILAVILLYFKKLWPFQKKEKAAKISPCPQRKTQTRMTAKEKSQS